MTGQSSGQPPQQPNRQGQNSRRQLKMKNAGIIIACITAAGVIIAAIVNGGFGMLASKSGAPPASPVTLQATRPAMNSSPTAPVIIAGNHPLYQADFAQGDQGWLTNKNSPQWSYDNTTKVLASNGNSQNKNFLIAPYQPKTASYTVEAQIQYLGRTSDDPGYAFFGIFVRSGADPDVKGYDCYLLNNTARIRIVDSTSKVLNEPYALDTSWHTYRLEVYGSTITCFIDNQLVVQVTDNRFASPGLIGLIDSNCLINVRNLTVFS